MGKCLLRLSGEPQTQHEETDAREEEDRHQRQMGKQTGQA